MGQLAKETYFMLWRNKQTGARSAPTPGKTIDGQAKAEWESNTSKKGSWEGGGRHNTATHLNSLSVLLQPVINLRHRERRLALLYAVTEKDREGLRCSPSASGRQEDSEG